MSDHKFHISGYADFLTYVKAFTLQYVARRPYGRCINMDADLRSRVMPPEAGVIQLFHTLFHIIPLHDYQYMVSDIRQMVVPALVKECGLLECSTLPDFSSPTVRAKCKTRILLLYIACVGSVWGVLQMDEEGVQLAELLGTTAISDHRFSKMNSVDCLSMQHDTLFMAAILRCIQNNEGYATLLLFAITERYERLFHNGQQSFSIFDQNRTSLTPAMAARFQPLAKIANEAMATLFGTCTARTHVKLTSSTGNNIILNNQQCYAFTLALYNLTCEMDGGGTLVWDPALFSHDPPPEPLPEHTEHFLNQITMLTATTVDLFVSLDKPLATYFAGPITTKEVMCSIRNKGFGKAESIELSLGGAGQTHVNAFTKNRVVTQYIICPGLSTISCFNEAYIRNTRSSKQPLKRQSTEPKNNTDLDSRVDHHNEGGQTRRDSHKPAMPIASIRTSGQEFTGRHAIQVRCKNSNGKTPPNMKSKVAVSIVGYAGEKTTRKRHVYIYSKSPHHQMIPALSDFYAKYNHLTLDCTEQKPDWSTFSNTTQVLILANFNQSTCIPFKKFKALADGTPCFFSLCGSKRVKVTPRKDMQMIVISSCSPYELFGVLDSQRHRVVMNSIQIHAINARFAITRLDGNANTDKVFAEKIIRCNRRFVIHSNKISTGLGTCTFSIYKIQDNKGVGSCINTFNFHTSGNYLDLCISRSAVELDIMKSNPAGLYPVAIAISVPHNTCTTVDMPGILNPETALAHTKMHFDGTHRQMLGPTKTTRFPAHNVFVKHPDAPVTLTQNILPIALPLARSKQKRTCTDREQTVDSAGDKNFPPTLSKRPRAYAVFDNTGIVYDPQKYTPAKMKQMSNHFVSWELHKNNINTSYFNGTVLKDKLQLVLCWYLGQEGVEFNARKQNIIASLEKKAGALLPFSILFLAEMEYLMEYVQTPPQLNMGELFISRCMICTYGSFSRGNAYLPLLTKNMLSHISTQYRFPELQSMYGMCEGVLGELVGRDEVEIGQVRSLYRNFVEKGKSRMPLCNTRSRSDGLVPSLMYGSEHFVRKFLETMPIIHALKVSLKPGSEGMHIVSLLERNYSTTNYVGNKC